MDAARRMDLNWLRSAVLHCGEADMAMKTAGADRQKVLELLLFTLPLMEAEGRFRVTIGVGCTGGRHRSVAMAEDIYRKLKQADFPVAIEHRHWELG